MRTFKFRAWDNVKKVFPLVGFHLIGECTTFDLLKQYSLEEFNDLVCSQWTGLVDKNGEEIYEGDIIRFDNQTREGDVFEVSFREGCFCAKFKDSFFGIQSLSNCLFCSYEVI